MGKKLKKDGASSAPKQTLEGLTDDQVYTLTEQHRQKYEILLAAKKKATNELQQFGVVVKADLGKYGLDQIKSLIEGKTPEGETAIKARIERDMQVLRWMGVPIGSQADLFPTVDRTPIQDRAFAEGKRQGLAGESVNNPHHHTTEAHRKHLEGYEAGQAANASGIKKLDNTPKGSSPKDPNKEWRDDLAKQNSEVEASIKTTAQKIGSSRPTFEVQ
jgi:hypothetical protein